MSKNIRTQIGKVIGKTLNSYHARVKPVIDDIKFKEQYQGRIIDCMVGEVDDNYIETPETDAPIVKLEHSKEGIVKVPSIKGKTILVDSDGNETDTPAEGCKLVSVGEEEDNKLIILSKNKNLFNGKTEQGSINNTTGESTDSSTRVRTYYIKVKPNTSYCITKNISDDYFIHHYDINKNKTHTMISIGSTIDSQVISTTSSTEYIRIRSNNKSQLDFSLVESNIIIDYVPYAENKTEILLDEPLKRISDTIYDEIQDNSITYKTVKKVLDGSEDWRNFNNPFMEKTETIDVYFINNQKHNTSVLCDTFKNVNSTYLNDVEGISGAGGSGTNIWVSVAKSRLETPDRDGFKKWLKENPITIIYELAEPIIEELPNSINLQGFDDTTMYIENSITPTVSYGYNALISYKEELSKQKEEVETNTLDIENNIIPYLMDMEFNLMLMEDNE